jgi:hypothetical protein
MKSRGGETGGLTLRDAIQYYVDRGYKAQFGARVGGAVMCFACQTRNDPKLVELDSLRRVEGSSDPDDMAVVAALRCPNCGAWGTGTFMIGPMASPEDNEALRLMDDVRRCMQTMGPDGVCDLRPPPSAGGPEPLSAERLDHIAEMERRPL